MGSLLVLVAAGCAGSDDRVAQGGRETISAGGETPSAQSSTAAEASALGLDPMGPVLQAAIDAPQLEPYWHLAERPDRSPLVLVRFPALEGNPKLFKFGKAVEYRAHDELEGRPHLEVQSIAIKPDRATVVLGYSVEGIVAHVHLVRETGAWVVAKADVVEH